MSQAFCFNCNHNHIDDEIPVCLEIQCNCDDRKFLRKPKPKPVIKTGMTRTSLDAYHSIKTTLRERQIEVLQAYRKLGASSNLEIAKHLNKPINSITPRTKELKDQGLLVYKGQRPCKITNNIVEVWQARINQ